MARQKVYGKRSRTVFDVRAADAFSSSPEHVAWTSNHGVTNKTRAIGSGSPSRARLAQSTTALAIPLENEDACRLRTGDAPKAPPRKALGEINANSLVAPITLNVCTTPKTKRPKRKTVTTTPGTIDATCKDCQVTQGLQNTTAVPTQQDVLPAEAALDEKKQSREVRIAKKRKSSAKAPKCAAQELVLPEPSSDDILQIPAELPSLDSTVAHQMTLPSPEVYQAHLEPILHLSPHPLTPFATWSSLLDTHFTLSKIAEASFGEVFRLSFQPDPTDLSDSIPSSEESVFKVIPLRPPPKTLPRDKRRRAAALRKSEMMTAPPDIATEVRLLQRMSMVPGFTNFRDVRIVQGQPVGAFVQACRDWDAKQKSFGKEGSHFPDPGKKGVYDEGQCWAIIEMQDAGTDLERVLSTEDGQIGCRSVWEVWDVFWQVVLSLAKGEEGSEFEHRDLHLGNVCIRRTHTGEEGGNSTIDPTRKLGFTDIETTIIDYTISRCRMPDDSIAYMDLSRDNALFEGDSTEEYQYDIYRYMRGVMYQDWAYAQPTVKQMRKCGRTWEQFHPQTNLVWLHLILYKLLEQMEWSSVKMKDVRNKKERSLLKRRKQLEKVLLRVQELLDPGEICGNGMWAAGDLVALAVGEEWLGVDDVVGDGVDEAELEEQRLIEVMESLAM